MEQAVFNVLKNTYVQIVRAVYCETPRVGVPDDIIAKILTSHLIAKVEMERVTAKK